MKVAFFVHRFPELSETFILNQVTGLLDRGHDVTIFAEGRPAAGPVHPTVRDYELLSRTVYLDDAPRGRSAVGTVSTFARNLIRRPSLAATLRKGHPFTQGGRAALNRRLDALLSSGAQPDVIHCHFGNVALNARFATLVWKAPFVVSFYGHDCSRLPQRLGSDLYEPLVPFVDCATALSREMRERLLGLGFPPDRTHTHHIGVDLSSYPFRPRGTNTSGRAIRILTVGRLVEKKGIEVALRAMAELAGGPHDIEYHIVGDGALRPRLLELVREMDFEPVVRFHGPLTRDEVRSALDRADIFLLASLTAEDGDQEGTPTVLMEASAVGLPVVSTYHAGIPEVVRDGVTGLLVPEGDPVALAAAVRELLESPERWEEMGREGRAHVQESYNAARLSMDLENLYAELVEHHPMARKVQPR